MKEEYTHLTVILDRSGSMESIRNDTIGGFNAFLEQQKAGPGAATLTLVQFDTQDAYEFIHRFKPLKDVPPLDRQTYVPRAGTPLLDALGRGINDLDQSLGRLKESERPARVIFVVVTDGQENSSHEFTKTQIETMIKAKAGKDNWQFVFLSADLAAIDEARRLGVAMSASMPFQKNTVGTRAAWGSLSARTSEYRSRRKGKFGFDVDDRKHPEDPDKQKPS